MVDNSKSLPSPALPKPAALRQLKAAIFQWGGQQDWKIGKLLFSEKIVKIRLINF